VDFTVDFIGDKTFVGLRILMYAIVTYVCIGFGYVLVLKNGMKLEFCSMLCNIFVK